MKTTCLSCDIEYNVISTEAKEEGISSKYCPFCGFENKEELNFQEPDYTNTVDEDVDDWDDWHPSEGF